MISDSLDKPTVNTVLTSLFSGAFGLLLLFFAGDAPVLLQGFLLLPQRTDGFDQGPSFSHHPLPAPPLDGAAVHAALALVHVGAHGSGERETKPGWGLLCGLVGAAEVHGKDVLGQSEGGGLTENY